MSDIKKIFLTHYFIIPVVVIIVSLVGNYFTSLGLGGWYDSLILPELTPPGGFIGLAWSVIYLLSTISALIFYAKARDAIQKRLVTVLFLGNALLNVLWSYLFFVNRLIGWAVWDSLLLGLSVAGLIYFVYPTSKTAALLLLPYFGWVSFATYLNYLTWILN